MRDLVDEIANQHLNSVRIKEEYLSAACPFHKGGQERNPSFWISRSTGSWGCFSCHESGSDFRELLMKLGVFVGNIDKQIKEIQEDAKRTAAQRKTLERARALRSFKATYMLPEALLGVFDWEPLELIEAGFDSELLKAHDIGYDRERERVTFPIRDIYGNLAGISGRQPEGFTPKYKVYSGWQVVDGKRKPGELGEDFPSYRADDVRNHLWRCQFVYQDLLHNRHDQLIVVEGYKAALWLVQLGWLYVVALMGSSMSKQQERLIRMMGCDTWIFLDNNEAGRRGSSLVSERLADSGQKIYECSYLDEMPDWVQPDDLDVDEVEEILSTATRAVGGRRHGRKMARQQAR